ncbi:MAG TPA: hypothetical protein VFT77_06730, partial [Reyranella sp.]|nr:hypothetical protein [Reyranella sp.]
MSAPEVGRWTPIGTLRRIRPKSVAAASNTLGSRLRLGAPSVCGAAPPPAENAKPVVTPRPAPSTARLFGIMSRSIAHEAAAACIARQPVPTGKEIYGNRENWTFKAVR